MNKVRLLIYYFRRNNWIFDPRFYSSYDLEKIEKPIFLLGNQGDGITFFSRMLRRNKNIVSCSGSSDYWTGADEMQSVYEFVLPKSFRMTSALIRPDFKSSNVEEPRSWSYAMNDLVNNYINERVDYYEASKFLHVIAYCTKRFKQKNVSVRFLDKSQSYLLKAISIQKSMHWTNVYFLHITRDPYVTIYRAAIGKAGDLKRSKNLTFDEKLQIATEHWLNKANYILSIQKELKFYYRLKFEDIIANPEKELKKACNFLDLEFNQDMLPQEHHIIPFATKYISRWYPLNKSVNEYKIPPEIKRRIHDKIHTTSKLLGY